MSKSLTFSAHAEPVEAQKPGQNALHPCEEKRGLAAKNRRPLMYYLLHHTTSNSPGDEAEDWLITTSLQPINPMA